jgi:hypothetical protein
VGNIKKREKFYFRILKKKRKELDGREKREKNHVRPPLPISPFVVPINI